MQHLALARVFATLCLVLAAQDSQPASQQEHGGSTEHAETQPVQAKPVHLEALVREVDADLRKAESGREALEALWNALSDDGKELDPLVTVRVNLTKQTAKFKRDREKRVRVSFKAGFRPVRRAPRDYWADHWLEDPPKTNEELETINVSCTSGPFDDRAQEDSIAKRLRAARVATLTGRVRRISLVRNRMRLGRESASLTKGNTTLKSHAGYPVKRFLIQSIVMYDAKLSAFGQ